MATIRTILHPTDFSGASEAALELARALAEDYEARLLVLHVYTPPRTRAETLDREIEVELQERLKELVLDDRTVELTHLVGEGRPADAIVETAAREGCDLIVMGTHGRSGLRRAVMGSVAEEVSRRAACPVATIRPFAPLPHEKPPRRGGEGGAAANDPDHDIGVGD